MSKIQLKNAILIAISSLAFIPILPSWAGEQPASNDLAVLTVEAVSSNGHGLQTRPCSKNSFAPICLISLTWDAPSSQSLDVRNNSAFPANNVKADLTSTEVLQSPTVCPPIPPGDSCHLTFYNDTVIAPIDPAIRITIQGSNTRPAVIALEAIPSG